MAQAQEIYNKINEELKILDSKWDYLSVETVVKNQAKSLTFKQVKEMIRKLFPNETFMEGIN